jgi:hypothetical protein
VHKQPGWIGDFHPQAIEHAGHTTNPLRGRLGWELLTRRNVAVE